MSGRRLHDFNKHAYWAFSVALFGALLGLFERIAFMTNGRFIFSNADVDKILAFTTVLTVSVVGLIPGSIGANAYGSRR